MRINGPVSGIFNRVAVKDTYLKEIPIKKGTVFKIQPIGIHYSEKYYKNPREFRPDRWIEECSNLPAFALGGFSAGPRTCIGKHLAKLEAKIGLIKFMKRYEKIELPAKKIEYVINFLYQARNFKTKLRKYDEHS